MIVEKDSDLESMQKSKAYNGKYFILGGLIPVIEKNTKKKIRIEELKQRISNSPKMVSIENQNKLEEIILAFSLNLEGNHTDSYVRDELDKIAQIFKYKNLFTRQRTFDWYRARIF